MVLRVRRAGGAPHASRRGGDGLDADTSGTLKVGGLGRASRCRHLSGKELRLAAVGLARKDSGPSNDITKREVELDGKVRPR